jgi:hypothetical protein
MVNNTHGQTQSGIVTRHNFGNKKNITAKWAARFLVMCFNSHIYNFYITNEFEIFFSPVEVVILNCRAVFLLDFRVCEQKKLQLY